LSRHPDLGQDLKSKFQMTEPSVRASRPHGLEPLVKELSDLPSVGEQTEEQGILESFSRLPRKERELVSRLLETFGPEQGGIIRVPIPFGPKQAKERRRYLLPIYRLLRYHRLLYDSVVDGAVRSTYLPWVESITTIKAGPHEELELRLNGNYGNVWRTLKGLLGKAGVRLKSQYSSRLYQWAKQNLKVGFRRVSLATLRQILGLEDIRDESGKLVQEAPLESWAAVKQRALDHALREINENSDIKLTVEFTGRGNYRKVNSLGFRITAKKQRTRKTT
jgi:hypothetical protein